MTKMDNAFRKELFEGMLYVRLVEEEIANRYSDQEMRCPVHLSIGQEAAAVGVGMALQLTDLCYSTHRCHSHYLAKGGDLEAMLGEIYGKETGCVGGRGGSMHLMDMDVGFLASVPIVGSSIPLAVGQALADKIDGKDRVSVAYFGDGAVEEGVFHESANFASLHNLNVLFVCENNLYSVYTPLADRQPDGSLERIAGAHNIPTVKADGNDVEATYVATADTLEKMRAGGGPAFMLLPTYRWREHCGPGYDNHIGYRTEAEFEAWKERDPVATYAAHLAKNGVAVDEDAMRAALMKRIDTAFAKAQAAPLPPLETAAAYVYA